MEDERYSQYGGVEDLQIEIVQVLRDRVDGTHKGTIVTLKDDAEVPNRESEIESNHHPARGARFAVLGIVGDLDELDLILVNWLMDRLDALLSVCFARHLWDSGSSDRVVAGTGRGRVKGVVCSTELLCLREQDTWSF